ncbi:MAG: protein kinase [Deltaproteobacteria bacterium]|nr:protein kinase [Deltaproteobacteria bacterium]
MAQSLATPGAEDTRELREAGCGRVVGRYTLLRRIAAGGMAEVYSARSRGEVGFAKRVAIKKILPQYSHNERFISMLLDEAKITVALDHPNIAQVHELGHDGEDYFIVMEYVDGRPLNKLMQRVDERGINMIPVEHACHIMSQVALGLHHAHSQVDLQGNNRNIVHRDVSPQNVLVSYDGHVKLIDFGIARAEGRLNQTSAGVIKGKLRYLAPEIASGQEPDARADVFCCGIVLFEMLTGEAMFAPKSDLEAIELATQARVKSPRARNRKVPQDLDDICMKALKRDRADRYQSARELYADLRRFLNQAYPAFVDSDLGDLMRDLFAVEMREDKRKDEAADRVAEAVLASGTPLEAPTVAMPGPGSTGSVSYKQLVTRVAIEAEPRVRLVDDEGSMDVIPADPGDRPLIRQGSMDGPGTLPPQSGPGAGPGEPTVKAQNPFVSDVVSGLPTVAAPAPDLRTPSEPSRPPPPRASLSDPTPTLRPEDAPTPRASLLEPEDAVLETSVAEDPSLLPPADQRRARPWPLWVGGGALILALLLAVVMLWPSPDVAGEPQEVAVPAEPEGPPIEVEPVTILPPPGRLVLEVEPPVLVSVTVGGRKLADRVQPPVILDDIPAGEQRITLSADGYRSITIDRPVRPNTDTTLQLELEAAIGSIELLGFDKDYRVEASLGEVKGNQIVNIPVDREVSVVVHRPGLKPFRTTLEITEPRPHEIEIPEPRFRPTGTLVVHTRPVSTVYVDGKRKGRTPQKLRLTAGNHKVVLKGPGGKEYKTTRVVRAGRTTRFQFQW